MVVARRARALLLVGVCALLLATARYALVPSTTERTAACSTRRHVPGSNTIPPPSYKQALLEVTRTLVALDTLTYNYSRRLQPAAGGTPLRAVVVSTWRSGSSFLGHLLSATPASLYFFEPLWALDKYKHVRTPAQASRALSMLRNIMTCKHDELLTEEYFEWASKHISAQSTYWHVIQYWKQCPEDSCYEPEFLSQLYELFPIQIIKLARIRLHLMEDLLNDDELKLRVVVLVRDPRAVLASRLKIGHLSDFCPEVATECEAVSPGVVCGDMVRDYHAAARLHHTATHTLTVLRFEDLALNLDSSAEQLFQFLQLELTPAVHKFIQTHTNVSKDHAPYSTYRNTKQVPFQWKKDMIFSIVNEIQSACAQAMSLWGYMPAHNASHLASDLFIPITPYSLTTSHEYAR